VYYLDTSFLVPLFVAEPDTVAVLAWMRAADGEPLFTSDWTIPEFASVLARRVRMKQQSRAMADKAFDLFERWIAGVSMLSPARADYDAAARHVRSISGLRAPDALHLAMQSTQANLTLMTFDVGMAKAARRLGLAVGRLRS
jgi:predicted nucleic acid-binding protein